MERIPIPKGVDEKVESVLKQIMDDAPGQMIALSAVPTGDVLTPGQIGFYGNDVYIRTSTGSRIKLSGSSWS